MIFWADTGETRRGLPIWQSSCGVARCRISSLNEPTCCCWCGPLPPFAGLPCSHRSSERTIEISLCGTCRRTIAIGSCELLEGATCTVEGYSWREAGKRITSARCRGCSGRPDSAGSSVSPEAAE